MAERLGHIPGDDERASNMPCPECGALPSLTEHLETASQIEELRRETEMPETVEINTPQTEASPQVQAEVPPNLFHDQDLNTLSYSVELDPVLEVEVSIKIPKELYDRLHSKPKGYKDVPDWYSRQIDANSDLFDYLDQFWLALNSENVHLVACPIEGSSPEKTLERARRSVTRIQFEVIDRIEEIEKLRKESLWGNNCLYHVDSPFA